MTTPTVRSARTSAAVAATALVLLASLGMVASSPAGAAAAAPGDGTTSTTAGASCWGIKQQYPASTSGTYWLNTARLERPQQFACDMVTDGGGWVLIGRGRNGWSFSPLGQGSPTTLRTAIDGPDAFAPVALGTSTITALLNGSAVSALADGVRIERSLNPTGTSRQQLALFPKTRAWTWNLASGQPLDHVTIDGATYAGSNTYDTSASVTGQPTNGLQGVDDARRLYTWRSSTHANQAGFAFGSTVRGATNAATNHLWVNTTESNPLPFTRVWIRPRVANASAGFTALPPAGLPAKLKPVALSNRSQLAPWGVEGITHVNETTIEPWKTNVLSLKVAGSRVFVGGRFTTVRNGPAGSAVSQPFLAAFDLSGQWISTFRPTLDGRVWDMEVLPNGNLVIAGDFTTVNGQPNTSGLAALDPATGAVVTTWKATIGNTNGKVLVRTLDQRNGLLYAAGSFNQVTGGTWNTITVSSAVSLFTSDGHPGSWRPRLTGQGVDAKVTRDGTRVLVAGYFNAVNGDANHAYFAITDVASGVPISGIGPWAPSYTRGFYQQAVNDLGDGRILVGGSQHDIQLWNWNRTQLLDSSIASYSGGGDIQAIQVFGDRAYFGCHCSGPLYQGTNALFPTTIRANDPVNLVGSFDTTTWEYNTEWLPTSLKGGGEGIWAIDQDAASCLWVGGDLTRGAYSGNAATDYLGGFARFCPSDVIAPTAPTALSVVAQPTAVRVTWGASSDASGTVSYDVYRDDRVIATVWSTGFTDATPIPGARYTVRATDIRGNQSATPTPRSAA